MPKLVVDGLSKKEFDTMVKSKSVAPEGGTGAAQRAGQVRRLPNWLPCVK
jgi:hypothetical protein